MPLLNRTSALEHQYSKTDKDCENNLKKNDDDADDLLSDDMLPEVEIETADDLLAALDAYDDVTPAEWSNKVTEPEIERSKNVLALRSKNVSARERRSPAIDAITIAKMRSFRVDDNPPACTSSVSNPLPSIGAPITAPSSSTKARAPTPANDNLIPVWSLTGEAVTAMSATVALQLSERPALAFTFNLTPDAIAEALASPTGFLDSLKRSFDAELKRALKGVILPYWFAIDVADDGRLHIHGAFGTDPARLPAVREAMKAAWGEWDGPGKHKQLLFQTPCDDGWATYSMRNQRSVAKIIGPRTFTINQALRRDAEWAYTEIRRIMREGADT